MLMVPSFNLILNCYFHPVKHASTRMVFPLQTHKQSSSQAILAMKTLEKTWEKRWESSWFFTQKKGDGPNKHVGTSLRNHGFV